MEYKELKIGTRVKFNIANELDTGKAIIIAKEQDPDDGHWCYKLDVYEGSHCDIHRVKGKPDGDLWINDFEVEEIIF